MIGTLAVLAALAVLSIDAGQLEPPGPVAPTMHGLGAIGALGDALSPLVFDDQLGGLADLRAEAYIRLTVNGVQLEGDVGGGTHNLWTRVIGIDYHVTQPYTSGFLVTGRHTYDPLVVRMNIEKNWPLIYKAVAQNETLTEARIEWTRLDLMGTYYTMVLTGGTIARAEMKLVPTPAAQSHILEVRLTFQDIEVTWNPDATRWTDTWAGGGT